MNDAKQDKTRQPTSKDWSQAGADKSAVHYSVGTLALRHGCRRPDSSSTSSPCERDRTKHVFVPGIETGTATVCGRDVEGSSNQHTRGIGDGPKTRLQSLQSLQSLFPVSSAVSMCVVFHLSSSFYLACHPPTHSVYLSSISISISIFIYIIITIASASISPSEPHSKATHHNATQRNATQHNARTVPSANCNYNRNSLIHV